MNKLLKSSKQERQLFIHAYILLTLVRLGLFLLPFQQLRNMLKKVEQFQPFGFSANTTAEIIKAINRSSRLSPGTVMCLTKALTSTTLMNIYSLPSKLNIGVALGENKELEAHAWVEAEGIVIMGYLPDLYRFNIMNSTTEIMSSTTGDTLT